MRAIGGRQPWGPRRALVIGTGAIGMLATYLLRMEGLDVWAADRAPDANKQRLIGACGATVLTLRWPTGALLLLKSNASKSSSRLLRKAGV